MKKILCVALSLLLIFSLAACGGEEKASTKTVDLEKYSKSDGIPECKYTLGTDVETLKDELSDYAESEEGSESLYDEYEGEETVCVTNGVYNFYYEKDNEDAGVAYIASFDKAFGFEIGGSILTVKEALANTKYTEEETNDENTFFMFAPITGSVIKCEFEKNTIIFVFENSELCATAIYRNDFFN